MAELVTDYLEHALPLHTRLAARVHLFACSACAHYFDQMRRTARLLRSRPNSPSPVGAEEEILRRIKLGPPLP